MAQKRHMLLDDRVSVYKPATTTNAYNEQVAGYTFVGKFWTRWRPLSGSERMQAEKLESSLDGEFTFRRSTTAKAFTHRYKIVRANGDEYQVVGTPTYTRDRALYMKLPARMVTHG